MMQHSSPMKRRTFFKLGIGVAAVLGVGGASTALWQPGLQDGALTSAGRAVFRATARAVLDGSLPAAPAACDAALSAHLTRLDSMLHGFPLALQDEVSRFVSVLALPPGRRWLAGLRRDWPQASVDELQAALQAMRLSSVELRQQTYHALRDLTNAAFYADAATWPLMGYPGPLPV